MKRSRIVLCLTTCLLSVSCASVDIERFVERIGEKSGNEKIVKSVAPLTPSQEYYLGQAVAAQVLANFPPVSNDEINNYVNVMGHYLSAHSSRPEVYKSYQFAVVESEEATALSAPSGYVFVTAGMLKLAQTEDELAAIIAHEIAHVALKHAEKSIKRMYRAQLLGEFGRAIAAQNEGSTLATLMNNYGEGVLELAKGSFDANEESEADAEAVRILRNAGYRPKAMVDILARMKNSGGFLTRHPTTESRVQALNVSIGVDRVPASSDAINARAARYAKARSRLTK